MINRPPAHGNPDTPYGGYPAVSFPYPVYKPLPPAFRVPKLSTSVDPVAAEHDWHGDYRDPDHASKVSRR